MQLVLGGDVMLGRGVNDVIRRLGPGFPLEQLQPLLCGCCVAVNLECAISSEQRQYSGPPKVFYFRGDPGVVDALTAASVNAVSLANNHALDADAQGLRETLKILEKKSILPFGAGLDDREAAAARVINAGGFTLGFLAACDHQRDFAAGPDRPGIRCVHPESAREVAELARDVAALAEQVDAVIVALHWQSNWERQVRPMYRQVARQLIRAGAAVIWGHGPHHFQGVEWFAEPKPAVVLYSTGDLVDDYATDPAFRNDRQLLFKVEMRRDRHGRASPARVRAHPLQLNYARTQPAAGEARRWIIDRFRHECAAFNTSVEEESDGWLNVLRQPPA